MDRIRTISQVVCVYSKEQRGGSNYFKGDREFNQGAEK